MKHCKILRYLFTAAALLSGLGFGLVGSAQPALAVTDLAPSHWAASTINAYVSRGIMSGYPDGTFRPEASVTRAEFVKMVNSVFGYNTPAAISFPDVSASYWGYDEIAKGVYAGYINGDESGKFNPDAPLTREEAASIICRIKGLAPNQSASSNYTDSSRIASWAAPYVGAATQFGYMQGNGDGTFNPTKALTRAEAATVLAKAESSKTYTTTPGSSGSSNNNNNNNNANNNVLGKPGVSNSTNTDKVKDYTMSTRDKTLANKTITGNLYIPSGMSSSTINLDDLTVEGTVYVRGGSTIDVDDCEFNKVVIDKSGVSFITDTHSTIDELEFWRNGRIEGKGYGEVTIADNSVSSVNVNATVDSLLLDTDSDLRLGRNANIEELEVTSKANNANVYFSGDAYVDEMRIYDHIDITGSGEINKMYTYVSGIYSSIEPNRLITSGSGTKPNYTDRDDDDDDDDNSNNNNNNNNNNKPGGSNTPSDKNLVVTGNIDGSDAKKGNATYDTVTVTKAGVTISNIIIDKNLTIEASVADGNVTLDHVTIKGQVYIHGGGQNSVIFSDCALEKNIYIDKKPTDKVKQPVGLKLNNGTTLKGDIILQNNANITTSPKEYTLNNVVVNGTLTEPLKIDANIDKLTVNTSSNLTIELDNSNINNLVAKKAPVTAKGSGNINDVSSVPNLNVDMLTPPDENTKPDLPNFKAIISLSGIPEKIEKDGTIQLNNIQAKYSDNSTATISNVEWKVTDDKAGVTITDNLLRATKTGSFTLTATIANGKAPGTDYTEDFTINIAVPLVSDIILETEPFEQLGEEYLAGQVLTFTMHKTVMEEHGANINWSVSGAGITEAAYKKDATTNKLILTIPPTFNGGTITVKAENTDDDGKTETKKLDITAKAFTSFDGTTNTFTISKPTTTATTDVKIGGTLQLSYIAKGITEDLQTITWDFAADGKPNSTQTKIDATGKLTIASNETASTIKVVATMANGKLVDNKLDAVLSNELPINIDLGKVSIIEAITKPPLTDNTYYIGQKITFRVDNGAAGYGNITWDFANQTAIAENTTGTMPTFTPTTGQEVTLTIPNDFRISGTLETLDVLASINGVGSQIMKIKVVPFTPVESINITAPGVTNNAVYVEVNETTGGKLKFTAEVKPDSRNQDYRWNCTLDSTSTKEGTKIENGELTIDPKRTTAFPVYATIPNGKIVNGVMQAVDSNKITVNPFTSIQTLTINSEKQTTTTGQKFKLTAIVTPDKAVKQPKDATWSISSTATQSGASLSTRTGASTEITIPENETGIITVTATIASSKLDNDGKLQPTIAEIKIDPTNGTVTTTTKSNPFTITKPTNEIVPPTNIPPTNQYEEEEEEEEDYKYNDDKKTAAELERERIEAEKEAQRKRQSAPTIGGGVKKNTVSAD